MRISSFILAFASIAISSVYASPAHKCTVARRLHPLYTVGPAFSDQEHASAAKYLQNLNLADNASLTLYPNGLPGIEVASNAGDVRNFALLVRQIVYKLVEVKKPVDYGNGTSFVPLNLYTGALHFIALPIEIHAGLYFEYNLKNCLIERIIGVLTIPNKVGGKPVPNFVKGIKKLAKEAKAMGRYHPEDEEE